MSAMLENGVEKEDKKAATAQFKSTKGLLFDYLSNIGGRVWTAKQEADLDKYIRSISSTLN